MDNDITVYMHGGNIFSGHFENADDEYLELFTLPSQKATHTSEHYRIKWDHIDRLEFTGKRAKTGFEFIGLEFGSDI